MNNQITVNIICNAFNHGPYIRDALESFVSQQTTFPFDVLVHDDASTDNTADIIREYEAKYPDIIKPIYQTKNQYQQGIGVNKTFQRPRVNAKYVALCEGDDYWTDPLKLQKQVDFMENHPEYSMCACSVLWLNMRTGKSQKLCHTDIDRDISMEEIILEEKGRIFQYATILTKSECFVDMPEWAVGFGVGDTPLIMNAALHGKVRMLADVMAVYRNQTAGSWTARISANREAKVKAFNKLVSGFSAFNKATEYKYDDIVSIRLRRQKYKIAIAKQDLKTMLSKELREEFRAKDLPHRFSDLLQCMAPKLQAAIMKRIK